MYERLQSALTNVSLMKGIKQASPLAQTSCLEGFHSVLNHFAPKMIAYSYIGMYCRYGIVQSYLRTFALIVSAHPYCARKFTCHVMPRHASSARAKC